MKQGFFRKIFVLSILVVGLALLFAEVTITSAVRERRIADLRQQLSVQITLLSHSISFEETALDAKCRQFKGETGARVTVIAGDGRVLGDSDTPSAQMDNHLERTEIEQAALFGTGMAVRYSDTLRDNLLYVANKVPGRDRRDGFIRLAVPLRDVDRAIHLLRGRILFIVVVVLIAIGGFSIIQTAHLRKLLRQITDFSRSLARGEIDKRLFLQNAGEFSEIAENLTSMSVALQGMITANEEEKNRVTVILRSIPDALLIIDTGGMVSLSSASAREFFGDLPIQGMQFFEVVRNHEFSDLIEKVRTTQTSEMTEFRMDYPEERYLAVRVSPLFYKERELSGFVAVFHDITEKEKLEQVRKDFVANVSHELKTPITAIRGFADTLLEGAIHDRENAERFVRTIQSNSERISSLVDDLMTISKIELGVIRVEKSATDVGEVMGNVLELFRKRAEAKNLSLTISNRLDMGEISADRNRLIQILTNLVDNAIKFTEAGAVTFGVDREGDKSLLFVEDSGIGVPGKYLGRLGERFFRVDPARSRKMGGTGLGLAIVKHLVKAHGWSMRIESTPGKGTKVKIFLAP